ncbi:hypothetical protein EDC02_2254 [Micromonospora sp. Llam0]|uniref:hypothetical protein n=1 Tax=Micromonospora sp. Llam0 TaxID=2485143 RepID=UPI000FB6DA18|nr:hypothetical protein [Micromonospora sp. Llam0]ROO60391.1 hypothetical protein EDC02_2254 [Micromonospora sp. Llam0]
MRVRIHVQFAPAGPDGQQLPGRELDERAEILMDQLLTFEQSQDPELTDVATAHDGIVGVITAEGTLDSSDLEVPVAIDTFRDILERAIGNVHDFPPFRIKRILAEELT